MVTPTPMPFDGMAGDDVSVANAIAARYVEAGIDPAMAYDDPASAIDELGLKGYGL